jgi:hypothetical protein
MSKRRRTTLLALMITFLLIALPGWSVWRAVRQERMNQALIAAIRRNDTRAVLSLLFDGADANARDKGKISARQAINDFWNRMRGRKQEEDFRPSAIVVLYTPAGLWPFQAA